MPGMSQEPREKDPAEMSNWAAWPPASRIGNTDWCERGEYNIVRDDREECACCHDYAADRVFAENWRSTAVVHRHCAILLRRMHAPNSPQSAALAPFFVGLALSIAKDRIRAERSIEHYHGHLLWKTLTAHTTSKRQARALRGGENLSVRT